eukprot:6198714-Pleurochrysis_carterae.AAC.4
MRLKESGAHTLKQMNSFTRVFLTVLRTQRRVVVLRKEAVVVGFLVVVRMVGARATRRRPHAAKGASAGAGASLASGGKPER